MKSYVIGGIVFLLISVGGFLYLRGGADEKQREAVRDLGEYVTTRKDVDNATSDIRDDDVVLDRLRRHGRQQ